MTLSDWLSELERVEKSASKRPWVGRCVQKEISSGRWALYAGAPSPVFICDPWVWTEKRFDPIKNDAKFIAKSRNAFPKLLAIVRAQQEALEKINKPDFYHMNSQVWDIAHRTMDEVAKIVGGE